MKTDLRERLRHVYWIGGASGGGKSTTARHLAARHGWRLYATDDVMTDHARRTTPTDAPLLHRFAAMDMDQRWVHRSPITMLETFHWYRGEGFGLIVEDLLRLPSTPPVVAEGFRLLPHLVLPLLANAHQAVWLLPTPAFRRTAFAHRGSLWNIAGRITNPERALHNLFERDRMFTDHLTTEVTRLALHGIRVDGTATEQELTTQVEAAFQL